MDKVITFIVTFLVIYILYLFIVILRKKGLKRFTKSTEYLYLTKKYKLDVNKLEIKKLANTVALTNSFIISIAMLVTTFLKNTILKLMFGFITIFPLIIICYHLIGIKLKKKEN